MSLLKLASKARFSTHAQGRKNIEIEFENESEFV